MLEQVTEPLVEKVNRVFRAVLNGPDFCHRTDDPGPDPGFRVKAGIFPGYRVQPGDCGEEEQFCQTERQFLFGVLPPQALNGLCVVLVQGRRPDAPMVGVRLVPPPGHVRVEGPNPIQE